MLAFRGRSFLFFELILKKFEFLSVFENPSNHFYLLFCDNNLYYHKKLYPGRGVGNPCANLRVGTFLLLFIFRAVLENNSRQNREPPNLILKINIFEASGRMLGLPGAKHFASGDVTHRRHHPTPI